MSVLSVAYVIICNCKKLARGKNPGAFFVPKCKEDIMKEFTVYVDARPKNCIECPLNRMLTHQCGETKIVKGNGSATSYKAPDKRCQLIIR